MSDHATTPVKRLSGGRYAPGSSGNPKGRPRSGLALAETIRAKVDPEAVVELVLRLASDESVPLKDRLAALLPWMAAGYLRPPTATAVSLESVDPKPRERVDWGKLPL